MYNIVFDFIGIFFIFYVCLLCKFPLNRRRIIRILLILDGFLLNILLFVLCCYSISLFLFLRGV